MEQTDFPSGFEPWEEYTGAPFVFGIWPEHRRAVLDGVELVASPWPSLDLATAFQVLWSWVERDRDQEVTTSLVTGRAAEVLAWTEVQALVWLVRQE